jgi:hypothetical protein
MANNASGEFQDVSRPTTETSGAAEGAGVGAGIGAALGGIGGLLVGLGALTIPGIGPVLAAGPLAAALGGVAGAGAGAIAGGATGGVLGALGDMGVNQEQAGYYAEGVRRGGTLLTVRADENMATRVVDVMDKHNPIDIRNRATSWRESGWMGFDPNARPFERDELNRERSRYGSTFDTTRTSDTGMGTGPHGTMGHEHDVPASTGTTYDTTASGRTDFGTETRGSGMEDKDQGPVNTVGSMTSADVTSIGRGAPARSFDTYESGFRRHYDTFYGDRGYTYNQYMPAYRYGYDLATNEQYRGRDWNDIEMDARHRWETEHPDSAWDDFKDAIRHSWNEVKNAFR